MTICENENWVRHNKIPQQIFRARKIVKASRVKNDSFLPVRINFQFGNIGKANKKEYLIYTPYSSLI
jgi:hypothetical protein